MRKAYVALLFIWSATFVQAQKLTESAEISLLTGSPGTELYSTFGHSAIRVKDPEQLFDLVFNYGTFDFNTPNFYLKFARGKLQYKLSIETFDNFQYSFKYENRSVVEQKLNLTYDQKQRLFQLLQENYKPENRYYKYDFFFDNCATRIRDIMITAFGRDFTYHYPVAWQTEQLTFRNLIDLYLTYHHWSDFGIDLALGLPTDGVASPPDYMFLPDYLAEGFATATIVHSGQQMPFTSARQTLLSKMDVEPKTFFITPARLMWFLFIISGLLSVLGYWKSVHIHWFDVLYFNVIGLTGWMVFLLWFFTDHVATKENLNLLWAVPFHFPVFLFWNKWSARLRKWYILIFGGIDLLILLTWAVFPQNYHIAFIPMILVMLLRFIILFRSLETKPIRIY